MHSQEAIEAYTKAQKQHLNAYLDALFCEFLAFKLLMLWIILYPEHYLTFIIL